MNEPEKKRDKDFATFFISNKGAIKEEIHKILKKIDWIIEYGLTLARRETPRVHIWLTMDGGECKRKKSELIDELKRKLNFNYIEKYFDIIDLNNKRGM